MTLISALLGLFIDRLLGNLHEYRRYRYFLAYVEWMRERLAASVWDGTAGLLAILLPVLLVVALLQEWTADLLFGLTGVAFHVVAFVYCLGPRDLAADVDTYCEVCGSSDDDLRRRAAERLLDGETPPDDAEAATSRVTRGVLVSASDRLFAVLLWFIVLGPVGAVLYRAVSVLYRERSSEDGFGDSVAMLFAILVWIPARLTALGYALSGHFDAALEGWRAAHGEQPRGAGGSERVLAETGLGALDVAIADADAGACGRPVRAAMRLVWRTLVVWLVGLSMMTLAGWAG